jgi:hypothetical protein
MNDWHYTSEDACMQQEYCSRCQAPGTKQRVEHIWGDWQHSNAVNGPVRVCRRCAELQARSAPTPAAPTRAPGAQSYDSRQEMFNALKPKMQQIAESTAALGRSSIWPASISTYVWSWGWLTR